MCTYIHACTHTYIHALYVHTCAYIFINIRMSRNGGGITATMVPPLDDGKVLSSKADHDDKSGPVSPDAPSRQGSSTRIRSSAGSLCCMAASKGGRQVCGKLRARVGKRQVGLVSTCGSCGHAGSHVLREIMYTCAERVWCLLSLPC